MLYVYILFTSSVYVCMHTEHMSLINLSFSPAFFSLAKMPSKKVSKPKPPASSSSSGASGANSPNSEEDSLYSSSSPKHVVRKESEQRRRVMMNQYFDELVMLLTVVTDRVAHRKMDKVTTLQETVRIMKLYYNLDKEDDKDSVQEYRPGFLSRGEILHFLMNSLSAFMMVVSGEGKILYLTDLISSLTGHLPPKLIGQSIYDYIHSDDKEKMAEVFKPPQDQAGVQIHGSPIVGYPSRELNCRFKMYMTESSSSADCSKDFNCLAYLRTWQEPPSQEDSSPPTPSQPFLSCGEDPSACVLLLVRPTKSLSIIDHPITTNDVNFQFDLRISKEGKILDIDKQASLVLGYTNWELSGCSFFDYVHSYHVVKVGEIISSVLNKGIGVTQPYRLQTKSNQYLWVVSKGYLSCNPWNHKPDHILFQSKVLGSDEILPEYREAANNYIKMEDHIDEVYQPSLIPLSSPSAVEPPPKRTPVPNSASSYLADHPLLQQTNAMDASFSSFHSRHRAQRGGRTSLFVGTEQPKQSRATSKSHAHKAGTSVGASSGEESHRLTTLEEVQQELERKNQELFNMQCKMLAQQQLYEQERTHFYQVTHQVMQRIGSQTNQDSILPPGLAIAVSSAGFPQPSTTASSPLSCPSPSMAIQNKPQNFSFSHYKQPDSFQSPPSPASSMQFQQSPSFIDEILMATSPQSSGVSSTGSYSSTPLSNPCSPFPTSVKPSMCGTGPLFTNSSSLQMHMPVSSYSDSSPISFNSLSNMQQILTPTPPLPPNSFPFSVNMPHPLLMNATSAAGGQYSLPRNTMSPHQSTSVASPCPYSTPSPSPGLPLMDYYTNTDYSKVPSHSQQHVYRHT